MQCHSHGGVEDRLGAPRHVVEGLAHGRRIVKLAYARFEQTEADRQRFFDLTYRTPHTTSTFVQAVAEASGRPFDPFSYR